MPHPIHKCTNILYDYAVIINIYVSLMYELKKLERYLRVSLWDRALVLWKKNLASRGLTNFEKHRSSVPWLGTHCLIYCEGYSTTISHLCYNLQRLLAFKAKLLWQIKYLPQALPLWDNSCTDSVPHLIYSSFYIYHVILTFGQPL